MASKKKRVAKKRLVKKKRVVRKRRTPVPRARAGEIHRGLEAAAKTAALRLLENPEVTVETLKRAHHTLKTNPAARQAIVDMFLNTLRQNLINSLKKEN